MKQYFADPHAQYTLQIATPLTALALILLIWYFLIFLPRWLLWCITLLLAAAAIALSTLLIPMWFCTISYTISDTHITKKCGILFVREQTMRTQSVQFSSVFRTPFSGKTGMNYIPLHAYGGTIYLSFLSQQDAEEIRHFLQETVYRRSPSPPPKKEAP